MCFKLQLLQFLPTLLKLQILLPLPTHHLKLLLLLLAPPLQLLHLILLRQLPSQQIQLLLRFSLKLGFHSLCPISMMGK